MNSLRFQCSHDRLRLLLEDGLPTPEREQTTRHLEECEACRRDIESLAADGPWWQEAQDILRPRAASIGERLDHLCPDTLRPSAEDSRSLERTPLWFLAASENSDSLGRLGTYEIEQCIGRGGMGIVLKALDAELQRPVAIKVLSPELAASPAARRRFGREAQAAAAVVHPHVVPIHAVHADAEFPFLVMAFVRGQSLQQRIDRSGPMTATEVLRIGGQIARGLAAAHAQGLVHRDIKPANVLLENGVERVLITDFGLAQAADDAAMTVSGMLAGTPHYMSPEQARGERVDGRSDLFSLGSVLYAMCTGHPPFRAENTMAVLRRVSETPHRPVRERNSELPEGLARIIDRLLMKPPGGRFATAAEVADILEQYLAHLQLPAAPKAVPAHSEPSFLRWETEPDSVSSPPPAALSPPATLSPPAKPAIPSKPRSPRRWAYVFGGAAILLAATLGITAADYIALQRGADAGRQSIGGGGTQNAAAAPGPWTAENEAMTSIRPIVAGKYRSQFTYDFRGGAYDARTVPPVGPSSLYGLRLLKPGQEGMRITIPASQGTDKPNIGVAPAVEILGDFEITATYKLLSIETPDRGAGAGANLHILPEDTLQGAALRRAVRPGGDVAYLVALPAEARTGQPRYQQAYFAAAGEAGKLRLVRTADQLEFLVAENEEADFRLLHQTVFSTSPIGLMRMEAHTGGARCALDMLWKEVSIRAEQLRPMDLPVYRPSRPADLPSTAP